MIVDGGLLYVREVKLSSLNCCNVTYTDVYIQVGSNRNGGSGVCDHCGVPGPRTSSSAQPDTTRKHGAVSAEKQLSFNILLKFPF